MGMKLLRAIGHFQVIVCQAPHEEFHASALQALAQSLQGPRALRARAQGLRADHIAWARKVDKAAFLNEFDRETLLGKTFATGADRGRT